MKSIILLSAFLLFAMAEAASTGSSDTCTPVSLLEDEEGFTDEEISNMLFCIGHGTEFNGSKTCQVGCRVVCQQPGCSGFKECIQIPNSRLHKYKCQCNEA